MYWRALRLVFATSQGFEITSTSKFKGIQIKSLKQLPPWWQVALNDEAEYDGGRLVFATSAGFEVPHRPVGTACIHTFEIVHGVTSMVTGTRYR